MFKYCNLELDAVGSAEFRKIHRGSNDSDAQCTGPTAMTDVGEKALRVARQHKMVVVGRCPSG